MNNRSLANLLLLKVASIVKLSGEIGVSAPMDSEAGIKSPLLRLLVQENNAPCWKRISKVLGSRSKLYLIAV